MANLIWRKAQRSNDQGGSCVERAALAEGVGALDSKDPDGPRLALSPVAFRTLMAILRQR